MLCLVLPDGQKEARKKQRTLGTAKNLKYVLADSGPWMNSGYYVACRAGKTAVLTHAVPVHTNCEKRTGKSKREHVGQDELTVLIGQCYPRKKMHFAFLEVFQARLDII